MVSNDRRGNAIYSGRILNQSAIAMSRGQGKRDEV